MNHPNWQQRPLSDDVFPYVDFTIASSPLNNPRGSHDTDRKTPPESSQGGVNGRRRQRTLRSTRRQPGPSSDGLTDITAQGNHARVRRAAVDSPPPPSRPEQEMLADGQRLATFYDDNRRSVALQRIAPVTSTRALSRLPTPTTTPPTRKTPPGQPPPTKPQAA